MPIDDKVSADRQSFVFWKKKNISFRSAIHSNVKKSIQIVFENFPVDSETCKLNERNGPTVWFQFFLDLFSLHIHSNT